MKQSPAAIDKVAQVFYLSEGEKQLLLASDVGEGIFFAGPNHVAIRVVASPDEHQLITTRPAELLEMQKRKEEMIQRAKQSAEQLIPKNEPQPAI